MTFKQGSEIVKAELLEKYILHTQEKVKVRKIRNTMKNMAKEDPTVLCASFDLQQVMNLPITKEST